MSADLRTAYGKRARLFGRVAVTIGIAPAMFVIWNSVGLPGIPGINFGGAKAQADPGLVVRVAGTLPARSDANARHDRSTVVTTRMQGRRHSKSALGTAVSIKRAPTPASKSTPLPARTTDVAPAKATRATGETASPTPTQSPPNDAPATAPPVTLPALPPPLPALPTVQIPAVPIPVQLQPLPIAPALPALPPPVNAITLP